MSDNNNNNNGGIPMKYEPFKVGQRVRRKKTGEKGTIIGVYQVKEDQYRNRYIRGRWKTMIKHKAGRWMHKIKWDPNVRNDTVRYNTWMAVEWLEVIEEKEETTKIDKINQAEEKEVSMNKKPTYSIAFTGHRPNKIGGHDLNNPKRQAIIKALTDAVNRAVKKYGETHEIVVITGGALGVDQDAARIAYKLGIPFIVAVPCQGQDSKWPAESKKRYQKMLSLASEVVMVYDGPYNNTCMQDRNIWMVDRCDALIAVWDGTKGGTANCVKYAREVNKPMVLINPNKLDKEEVK